MVDFLSLSPQKPVYVSIIYKFDYFLSVNCGLVELKSRFAIDMMRYQNIYLIVEVGVVFMSLAWTFASAHTVHEHIMAIIVTII